ncbi:HAD family hydrolase [Vibrio hippocampi]|uniref:6-phosphogluconate phosphatase n=1 Tax=Vibrio hippocampi TaxID=654686 RepID=A0ABN8DNB3_9VIBR|nr:HAD-IA family hydrolase [Vibrio hippocampi]CAH0527134.1 6-phosphogluconate phosphatase [Vibrio hippocampi]
MTATNPIQCVIFDCDGTLIDSERLCLQALVQTLAEVGTKIDYEALKRDYQGIKIHIVLGSLVEDKNVIAGDGMEQLIARYRVISNELFTRYLTTMDGVEVLLESLIAKGIKICIASNAPHEKMQVTLPLTNLDRYFEGTVFSAFDAQAWKPDPKMLEYVMDKMQVKAEQCLFIDDSIVGVQAGVSAGIKTLYFAHDEDPDNPCTIDSPNLVRIEHLGELENHLSL